MQKLSWILIQDLFLHNILAVFIHKAAWVYSCICLYHSCHPAQCQVFHLTQGQKQNILYSLSIRLIGAISVGMYSM
jgi:hypothetical protein